MKATTITRRASGPISMQVRAAVEVLATGGLVALPTDTLYGLSASAFNEAAVRKVFSAKDRPEGMALPVLLADSTDLDRFGVDIPESARKLAARFWPGQLTIIVHKADVIPDIVTGGAGTVALRVPNSDVVREIVRALKSPIIGTSANRSGRPGLTTADDVIRELQGKVDLVLDLPSEISQPALGGLASTIVDVTKSPIWVLREGSVSTHDIKEICGEDVETAGRQ